MKLSLVHVVPLDNRDNDISALIVAAANSEALVGRSAIGIWEALERRTRKLARPSQQRCVEWPTRWKPFRKRTVMESL